jgi:oxygen-independent coproporphyrinogen-3 oxidase
VKTALNVGAILAKYPHSLPRYTSYPPANHFQPGGGLALREEFTAAVNASSAVSAYIHIPYCDRLCWFCGCHTKQTLRYEPVKTYVTALIAEIALWQKKLTRRPRLSRLHLGGGSPSLLQPDDLRRLRAALDATFDVDGGTEISVEIDPSDVRDGSIEALIEFGLTRASIGVQDFDPAVQAAINRPQGYDITKSLVVNLRAAGVQSINIDALYGLPLQTSERLARTITQVIEISPDRIALFGYAHVPWLKPHQKLIRDEDLPDTQERFDQARMAAAMIAKAGYVALGIDHFALPHDTLAQAANAGNLNRNFQGYTDDQSEILLPLGPSSIGRFANGYVQNDAATGQYMAKVQAGEIPFSRGLALTADDKMRGWVIERLMCDYSFCFTELADLFGPRSQGLVELAERIARDDTDGLCEVSDGLFKIEHDAWPFARIVAARFDAWLELAPRQYSKAV